MSCEAKLLSKLFRVCWYRTESMCLGINVEALAHREEHGQRLGGNGKVRQSDALRHGIQRRSLHAYQASGGSELSRGTTQQRALATGVGSDQCDPARWI